VQALALSPFVRQRPAALTEKANRADLLALKGLIESGKVTPVIDRTRPLAETCEAVCYLEAGHGRGKVVITA